MAVPKIEGNSAKIAPPYVRHKESYRNATRKPYFSYTETEQQNMNKKKTESSNKEFRFIMMHKILTDSKD
ncbi:hypothetical protein T4D_14704 [Trichinella pseudospiralis]|uniref:Uncharacterized protein n=1 Tax=Trichinella pseudospiralis TaxID=6337 RepID=A0A0V1G016_TRIPS|nr:hypothetical protein T4D_14704 [Trichinella pseudospiralis]